MKPIKIKDKTITQRQALHQQIWQIANDVRGSVDGSNFKQYVLGALFYRFMSEDFCDYAQDGDEAINYAKMADNHVPDVFRRVAIEEKGYFIAPSQLFENVIRAADQYENLAVELRQIFDAIEDSANGHVSAPNIKGLFADFDTNSDKLGTSDVRKNIALSKLLKGIASFNLEGFQGNRADLFADAYESLIFNYEANSGSINGEFCTHQNVAKLIVELALYGQEEVNRIYDPAIGSGSLLLQAKKQFDEHIIEEGFCGQDINYNAYNLARMNMLLHNVNYTKFDIALGDTLLDPRHNNKKPFDAIVSNPPYSRQWVGNDDPNLVIDDRYAPAGVLAPKSKADFAFVLHALSYLSPHGRAAMVCFPGILYREGAEQKIRQYLIDNNYVEAVISLAPNLFYRANVAANILVLSKNKQNNETAFIDASGFFKTENNNNVLSEENVGEILKLFANKQDVDNKMKLISYETIKNSDYDLSVSSYVNQKDKKRKKEIEQLDTEIKESVERLNKLRSKVNQLIAEAAQ